MSLNLAARTRRMNPSAIREILKVTERSGVLSMAGGLPAPESFPIDALARASERVWRTQGTQAMQYANSEGLMPLRQWIAKRVSRPGWPVQADQVLVTTGSQQGLDLLGKVLIDPGSGVLVEQPTYLGALQAFAAYEPTFVTWRADAHGPDPSVLSAEIHLMQKQAHAQAQSIRAAYLVPSYQNPTGRCIDMPRRHALAQALQHSRTTLVEDDPYGELWFDAPPPAPVAAHAPHQTVYLGSLSKVLAPGLRLGYAITPPDEAPGALALRARLLQAKQAADLHTPGFNQRLVLQLLEDGFDIDRHLDQVRTRYKAQRDAMAAALRRHLPQDCTWALPLGGMFFWVDGPAGFDAAGTLSDAVNEGVAYVPGSAFHVGAAADAARQMRLSFVTLSADKIDEAVARLAAHMRTTVNLAG